MLRSLLIAVSLCAYLVCGVVRLDEPGLQYDEVLFVNAAIGADRTTFVHLRAPVVDVPLTVMPYLGALKAWLLAPVFALFGVSAWTVRLPSVAIGALTLAATWAWVRRLFGPTAALVSFILLACDPAHIVHARIDWGPTSIMGLCKALLLLGTFAWLQDGRRWGAWLAVVAAAFGVFDKLNFVWLLAAIGPAVLACYGGALRSRVREQPRTAAAVGVAGVLLLAAIVVYVRNWLPMADEWTAVGELPQRAAGLRRMLAYVAGGDDVHSLVFQRGLPAGERHATVWAAGAGLATVVAALSGTWRRQVRGLAFLAIVVTVIVLEMLATRQATGPHHAMMVAPFGLVAVAALSSGAFEATGRWAARAVALAIVVVLAGSAGLVLRDYDRALDALAPVPNWDGPSQRALAALAASQPGTEFVHADWGTHTVLLALSQGRAHSVDRWPEFRHALGPAQASQWATALRQRPTLFVLHAAGRETFPETRTNLLALGHEPGWSVETVAELPGADGRAVIEVVRLTPP